MQLRYQELTDKQRAEARAMFLDAGSGRDDYWYVTSYTGGILCRNSNSGEEDPDYGIQG